MSDNEPPGESNQAPELRPEQGGSLENARLKNGPHIEGEERRGFPRGALELPVKLEILSESGAPIGTGKAILRELTLDGAYLDRFEIEDASAHEGETVQIVFTVLEGDLAGMKARCAPTRTSQSFSGLGVSLIGGFSFDV